MGKFLSQLEAISKLVSAHDDEYDYSEVVFTSAKDKIKIFCKRCNKFFYQTYSTHSQGKGCPECGKKRISDNQTYSQEKFIEKSKEVHGEKYDYSLVEYKGSKEKVKIICPDHGIFEQRASKHLRGQGCPECGKLSGIIKRHLGKEKFIEKSQEIFGDLEFNYDKVDYINNHTEITLIHNKCGKEFKQTPASHFNSVGCPHCYNDDKGSKMEIEFNDILNNYHVNYERHKRKLFSNVHLELDFYISDYNLGIEFNGLYWHSELKQDNLYHQNKYLDCYEKGINLIQIFEDEWVHQKEKVIDKLKGYLNIQKDNDIDINQCIVKEFDNQNTFDLWYFEEDNYLEIDDLRHEKSDINIVLKHDNEIVSILSLNKENDNKYIITRFFDKLNYQINDSFKTLLNWFIQNFKPSEISYLDDLRWSQEKLLLDNGFVFDDKLIKPKEYLINRVKRNNIYEIDKYFVKDKRKIHNAGFKKFMYNNINNEIILSRIENF